MREIENTYQMLFAAARSPQTTSPLASTPIVHTRPPPPQRQPSLHNFWTISSMAPVISDVPPPSSAPVASCQDCDVELPMADTDISMGGMDEDGDGSHEYACKTCRRRVCDTCAVVEIGSGRECLQCKTSTTRKKWVGGIGWMP